MKEWAESDAVAGSRDRSGRAITKILTKNIGLYLGTRSAVATGRRRALEGAQRGRGRAVAARGRGAGAWG
jgi:hypothetical protein